MAPLRQSVPMHAACAVLLWALACPPEIVAQEGGMLPMTYIRVNEKVARELAADWKRLWPRGLEWAYCVRAWTRAATQDGDTVFVITSLQPARTTGKAHEVAGFTCVDERGAQLPIAHAHPSGDCSASRTDAAQSVAYDVPFGLVVCGPGSTGGYTRAQFVLMIRGTWYGRSNGTP